MTKTNRQNPKRDRTVKYDRVRLFGFNPNKKLRRVVRGDGPARMPPGIPPGSTNVISHSGVSARRPGAPVSNPWWVPLRGGLVRDPTGKHRAALGSSVWLFLYFLVAANWRTGSSVRRVATIARETGLSMRTIGRWLKKLRDGRYINTVSNGRSLRIWVRNWRTISRNERTKPDRPV